MRRWLICCRTFWSVGSQRVFFGPASRRVQLYISIAGLGFFYLSNRWTLSTIFGRDLGAEGALAERGDHIVEVVLGYLRPDAGEAGGKSA